MSRGTKSSQKPCHLAQMKRPSQRMSPNMWKTRVVCEVTQRGFVLLPRVWTALTRRIHGTHRLTNWNTRMKGSEVILQSSMSMEKQHGLIRVAMMKQEHMPTRAS